MHCESINIVPHSAALLSIFTRRAVMFTWRLFPQQAQRELESGELTCKQLCFTDLTLFYSEAFNPTAPFRWHLELSAACEYRPTICHPLVRV